MSRAAALSMVLLIALTPVAAVADVDLPSADAILEQVGFGADDRRQVLAGDIAERPLASAGKRDLSVALALVLPATIDQVIQALIDGAVVITKDPSALAYGELPADAPTVDDFSKLVLDDDERSVYRSARPGESTNFSDPELALLAGISDGPEAVDAAVRAILLGRLLAYRDKGLAGMAPYARDGGKHTDPAKELREATRSVPRLGDLVPEIAAFLDQYPGGELPDYQDSWHWVRYDAHGERTLVLGHAFATTLEDGAIVAERQFYVSRSYNVEQAVAAFVPVKEGTLAVYWNHTSTDQVAGFGGGVKRSLGDRLMGSRLEQLFERIRKGVD